MYLNSVIAAAILAYTASAAPSIHRRQADYEACELPAADGTIMPGTMCQGVCVDPITDICCPGVPNNTCPVYQGCGADAAGAPICGAYVPVVPVPVDGDACTTDAGLPGTHCQGLCMDATTSVCCPGVPENTCPVYQGCGADAAGAPICGAYVPVVPVPVDGDACTTDAGLPGTHCQGLCMDATTSVCCPGVPENTCPVYQGCGADAAGAPICGAYVPVVPVPVDGDACTTDAGLPGTHCQGICMDATTSVCCPGVPENTCPVYQGCGADAAGAPICGAYVPVVPVPVDGDACTTDAGLPGTHCQGICMDSTTSVCCPGVPENTCPVYQGCGADAAGAPICGAYVPVV